MEMWYIHRNSVLSIRVDKILKCCLSNPFIIVDKVQFDHLDSNKTLPLAILIKGLPKYRFTNLLRWLDPVGQVVGYSNEFEGFFISFSLGMMM